MIIYILEETRTVDETMTILMESIHTHIKGGTTTTTETQIEEDNLR